MIHKYIRTSFYQHQTLVNIGCDNRFLLDGTKPLPDPIFSS